MLPDQLTELLIVGQVAIAMLLGAFIGLEREVQEKPAGLRTHMLVAGAATLFVALSDYVVNELSSQYGGGVISSDPVRIIAAVVTGVSFLGAGTIIRQKPGGHIEGLKTAASLLFAASEGIAVGLSLWILALGVTGLALFTLRIMPSIKPFFLHSQDKQEGE